MRANQSWGRKGVVNGNTPRGRPNNRVKIWAPMQTQVSGSDTGMPSDSTSYLQQANMSWTGVSSQGNPHCSPNPKLSQGWHWRLQFALRVVIFLISEVTMEVQPPNPLAFTSPSCTSFKTRWQPLGWYWTLRNGLKESWDLSYERSQGTYYGWLYQQNSRFTTTCLHP